MASTLEAKLQSHTVQLHYTYDSETCRSLFSRQQTLTIEKEMIKTRTRCMGLHPCLSPRKAGQACP